MATKIIIRGIVQGVGFRPFIYKLAHRYNLVGYVFNDGLGVQVDIQGEDIESFIKDIKTFAPPLSRIDDIVSSTIKPLNVDDFNIIKSQNSDISTMLSADMGVCDECISEMYDKTNRRYLYPFINCTNCGVRYSIIKNLPYDREQTSMSKFEMCEECRAEYEDATNRRYHTEPISCPKCAIQLNYVTKDGIKDIKPIKQFAKDIKAGYVVALKGLGGFHMLCDATSQNAVQELRVKKNRPKKPLAVMFRDIEDIKKVCDLTKEDEKLLLSLHKPIVLVKKKDDFSLASSIADGIEKIGVFLAYTPLHLLVLDEVKVPLIATSANLSGEPIITKDDELFGKLSSVIKSALVHNRDIINGCDDSVMQVVEKKPIMLRMARGYAPLSLYMKDTFSKKILAVGANQKSTIGIAFGNHVVISPYIGDLDSIDSVEYFQKMLDTFKRVYNFTPDVVVCDKHPNYESTKWAKEYTLKHQDTELIEVQHHFAHTLSCMAEYSLDEEVLAFCFDGTGYGDDGLLWGGEVLLANRSSYKRVYHLQNISLLGGEKAIKEPKRVLLGLLFEFFSFEKVSDMDIADSFSKAELKTLHMMYKNNINSPKTSSMGRLFDAVYVLCGFYKSISYDGEAGLVLENLAIQVDAKPYSYTIKDGVISYKEMIVEMVYEKDKTQIASRFFKTLTYIIIDITKLYPKKPVVLVGGVFQNALLLSMVIVEFKKLNIRYYIQQKTPLNDSGISLGQIYYKG